jgi:hypothetical protein
VRNKKPEGSKPMGTKPTKKTKPSTPSTTKR